ARGSCDYLLSNSIYGTDHLVGEVDLHNTGNVGTDVKVRITWPQEGQAPVARLKHVRTEPGSRSVVRFKVKASTAVIDSLQSWQLRHTGAGCTYHVTITGTFGQPQ